MEIKIDNASLKEIVDTQIQATVMGVLDSKGADLIKAVVTRTLTEKASSYGRETVFEAAMRKMIQDAAKETFKGWLDQNAEKIRSAIEARLKKSPQKFVNQIADKLLDGLAGSFHVSCKLKYEDD